MKFSICVVALLAVLSLQSPVSAANASQSSVSKTIVIDAPASVVWSALKTLRRRDSKEHHLVSSAGTSTRIEENFEVPVIGPVSCLYEEREIANRRVEYHLMSSPNFVAFEGFWDLSTRGEGKQTMVTLVSFADTGSHIPFASKITRTQTLKRVDKRMSELESLVGQQTIATLP